jgi:hypothetical protein
MKCGVKEGQPGACKDSIAKKGFRKKPQYGLV